MTVAAPEGLHARLAARIVRATRGLGARVILEFRERSADAASLASLLGLDAGAGSRIRLVAEGDDAEAALDQVARLLGADAWPRSFVGSGVSPGVGVGRAVLTVEVDVAAVDVGPVDRDAEMERLREALAGARSQLAALEVWAERVIGGASEVLRAERALLEDGVWLRLLTERICEGGASAPAAVRAVTRDPGLLPREAEGGPPDGLREVLRDVGDRLARLLARRALGAPEGNGEPVVLVSHQVSPSELLEWPRERLAGVTATLGSAQSHAALVARALRLPMVVGIGEGLAAAVSLAASGGQGAPRVRVDGDEGLVAVEPWYSQRKVPTVPAESVRGLQRLPKDRPAVLANANTVDAVRAALAAGAEAIGLVRTERLFLGRELPPDEEEQHETLAAIVDACAGRPVTLRMADLGGDKEPPYLAPLFGSDSRRWRGAGLLARYPALAEPHLRAMARAMRGTSGSVMVPMVATRAEWGSVLALWRRAAEAAGASAGVSLLVETPAVALDVEQYLPEVDQVAIGTNDLSAMLFGADRERGSTVTVAMLQPVMLRLLADVVRQAHDAGRPVTVCGEAAGSMPEALVLWGLGVDGLSVAPLRVAALTRVLGKVEAAEVRGVARELVRLRDVTQVLGRLDEWRSELAAREIALDE